MVGAGAVAGRGALNDSTARAPGGRLLRPGRLVGVDVARGIALIAMMSVHIIAAMEPGGDVSWAYRLFAGRASGLFAVLAGVSLVLSTTGRGHDQPLALGARRGVLARAGWVALIGMVVGVLPSGVAVILVNYAVLFAVGALFLGLPTRALLVLGAGWLTLAPVVGHLVRSALPPGPGPSPSLFSLAHPAELFNGVLFNGYYPVLQWTGYVLVGMALGRLPLHRPRLAVRLVVAGVLLAVGAKLISAVLLGPAGGLERLTVPPTSPIAGRDLQSALVTGLYGTTPTTSWWWLAVSAPHSGTPLDLLHTTGTSLAVIGACVLAAAMLGRYRFLLLPVAAAGSMPLTLYTLHVVGLAVAAGLGLPSAESSATLLWVNVGLAVALATAWQLTGRRGPLEDVAAQLSAAARRSAAPEQPGA